MIRSSQKEEIELVTIEVGGSGAQTGWFTSAGSVTLHDGIHPIDGVRFGLAIPGRIENGKVLEASNLGWTDVDPADRLGLTGRPVSVLNDAEAAALGEHVLRPERPDLLLVMIGTGIGSAVVLDGRVVAVDFLAHGGTHSDLMCRCGKRGCLETVAAGWAVSDPLLEIGAEEVGDAIADAIASAVGLARLAPDLVVLAGGMISRNPRLFDFVTKRLDGVEIHRSAAPTGAKSAAPWGIRAAANLLGTGR